MLSREAVRLRCRVDGVLVQIYQDVVIIWKLDILVPPLDTDNVWAGCLQS
jgi:hypothetical protein